MGRVLQSPCKAGATRCHYPKGKSNMHLEVWNYIALHYCKAASFFRICFSSPWLRFPSCQQHVKGCLFCSRFLEVEQRGERESNCQLGLLIGLQKGLRAGRTVQRFWGVSGSEPFWGSSFAAFCVVESQTGLGWKGN